MDIYLEEKRYKVLLESELDRITEELKKWAPKR